MTSQTDLDQGGTFRQYSRLWLGPSVGWVPYLQSNVLPVVAAGTASPVIGTTLVTVNVAGLVTIQLFDPIQPSVPAGALPGDYIPSVLTIVDIGGHAATYNITIAAPPGRNIMGLASIQIAEDYGVFALLPNLTTGNWTQHT